MKHSSVVGLGREFMRISASGMVLGEPMTPSGATQRSSPSSGGGIAARAKNLDGGVAVPDVKQRARSVIVDSVVGFVELAVGINLDF
jgi:hypothetical protein